MSLSSQPEAAGFHIGGIKARQEEQEDDWNIPSWQTINHGHQLYLREKFCTILMIISCCICLFVAFFSSSISFLSSKRTGHSFHVMAPAPLCFESNDFSCHRHMQRHVNGSDCCWRLSGQVGWRGSEPNYKSTDKHMSSSTSSLPRCNNQPFKKWDSQIINVQHRWESRMARFCESVAIVIDWELPAISIQLV